MDLSKRCRIAQAKNRLEGSQRSHISSNCPDAKEKESIEIKENDAVPKKTKKKKKGTNYKKDEVQK